MPRKKRSPSPPNFDLYDNDFEEEEDASSQSSQPPVQRNAANARERMRMRVLSSAYGRLKTKLPNIPPDTKLSKLDTLRLATLYIKQLITAVENGGGSVNGAGVIPTDTSQLGGGHFATGNGNGNGGSSSSGSSSSSSCSTSLTGGAFLFHNNAQAHGHGHGHGSMSWPFEFHQHLQQQSGNRAFNSSRGDWQTPSQHPHNHHHQQHQQQQQHHHSYTKVARQEVNVSANVSYIQHQDSHEHWYPTDGYETTYNHPPQRCISNSQNS